MNDAYEKFAQVYNQLRGQPGNWAYDFVTLLVKEGQINYKTAYSIALSQTLEDQLNYFIGNNKAYWPPVFNVYQLEELYKRSNIGSELIV